MSAVIDTSIMGVLSTDPGRLTHLVCPHEPEVGGRAICGWVCVEDGRHGPTCAVCEDLADKPCRHCGHVHMRAIS